MADMMMFPETVDEFMEKYKIVDSDEVYTNGVELVPIFRMKQWFEHVDTDPVKHGHWVGVDVRVWECDVCGWIYEDDEPYYNFCPHCGAKMDVSDTNVGKMDETCIKLASNLHQTCN